jgi:protocatechuate 3,4-dioxygenase, beta subunit
MKVSAVFLSFCMATLSCCSQNSSVNVSDKKDIKVGGPCEGCEAIYESPVAFDKLDWIDTLPDFNDPGPKLEVSGIIYKRDGKTPASNVVLYIYHTNQKGIYEKKGDEKGWGKRHGYIRGWVKTNEKGEYKFYTLVPASYPNSTNPKHIHPSIKEPGYSEYYIDEFLFDDDPLLPNEERTRPRPRGGNGVLKTTMKGGMLRATHNIILGLNIPDYPASASK